MQSVNLPSQMVWLLLFSYTEQLLACLLAVHVVIVWYHVVSWEWVTFVERIAEIDCVYVDK